MEPDSTLQLTWDIGAWDEHDRALRTNDVERGSDMTRQKTGMPSIAVCHGTQTTRIEVHGTIESPSGGQLMAERRRILDNTSSGKDAMGVSTGVSYRENVCQIQHDSQMRGLKAYRSVHRYQMLIGVFL